MINSTNQAKTGTVSCGSIHDYSAYPDNPYTPIKFVRIAFNVFQKADGSGSFNASDAIIKSYFQAFVDSVNYRLGNIQAINPAATSPKVIDSKIRVILNNTYIYKDDKLFNYVIPYGRDVKMADSPSKAGC